MPRRVPFSSKKRRAQILGKRALKRGDLPEPAEKPPARSKKSRGPPADDEVALSAAARSRMLLSSFLKPSPEFLEASKRAAAVEPLRRPVPNDAKVLQVGVGEVAEEDVLTCPRRPKWRYEMSKKEVEKNEEGYFEKWLAQTDEIINNWRQTQAVPSADSTSSILPAPTYYERNIEVWRQLWRVTELSSILMVLLDARCPPLHYPPSLDAYIKSLRPARQVILVLTKIDIVGEDCAHAWRTWMKERHSESGVQIVGVQSYELVSYGIGQGSRMRHEPHMPPALLNELLSALKTAHEALLEPPSYVKSDPERLRTWKPAVRTQIDWGAIGRKDYQPDPADPQAGEPEDKNPLGDDEGSKTEENEEGAPPEEYLDNKFLTVGVIGQPNVGKSSLLNALFGEHKVKASRTPGKTKHYQTLFLTPEVRLVDCPGLVLPALVPMELQVLSDVLPIAQIPALPACVHYVGNLMPIEDVFGVDKSPFELDEPKAVEDKRTWRAGMKPSKLLEKEGPKWTAIDVMSAYAAKKRWYTARTGWPDAMRAGDAMMRGIVEGKVLWSFWPPGSSPPPGDSGLWLQSERAHEDHDDTLSSENEKDEAHSEDDESLVEASEEEAEDDDEEIDEQPLVSTGVGRFATLEVSDTRDEKSEDEEDV